MEPDNNDLETSNVEDERLIYSSRERVRRNLYWVCVRDSPYWDTQSFKTMIAKAEHFCAKIIRKDRSKLFKNLVGAFIREMQPLVYIHEICTRFLPVSVALQFPNLETLITRHVTPLQQDRIERIRAALTDKKVFFSLTVEQFSCFTDPTTGKPTSDEERLMDFLFVIVGLTDESPVNKNRRDKKPTRYLLKVQKMLENEDDDLCDGWFQKVLLDSLSLLWPTDTDEKTGKFLTHLITEPQLELYQMFAKLRRTHSRAFLEVVHVPNIHSVMYQIEKQLRARFATVCEVIDTVRLQWFRSGAFRDKYQRFTTFIPPTSFYRSADFYCSYFYNVQFGVLKWKGARFQNLVTQTLSDHEIKQQFEEFSKQSELLGAMERANYLEAHALSRGMGTMLKALKQLYEQCREEEKDMDVYTRFIKAKVINDLGGRKKAKLVLNSGEFQLLHRIVLTVQASDTTNRHRASMTGRLTKYQLLNWHFHGGMCIPEKIPGVGSIEEWVEPLYSSQLRRSFPLFWYLFRKFTRPFPLKYMELCALAYCWAEKVFYDDEEDEEEDLGEPEQLATLAVDYSQSPFYDQWPRRTLRTKSQEICSRIIPVENWAKQKRIRLIVREYIRKCLPLTRVRLGCFLFDRAFVDWFPKPSSLAQTFVAPLYEEIIARIRQEVTGQKLFLSFTKAYFQNANDLYGELLDGQLRFVFVIVGIYGHDLQSVLAKYLISVEELQRGQDFSDERFERTLFTALRTLWPTTDFLHQAGRHIIHVITEPEFDMDRTFDVFTKPDRFFAHTEQLYYTHRVLHQVESSLTMDEQAEHPELVKALRDAAAEDPFLLSRTVKRLLFEVIRLNKLHSDTVSQRLFGKVIRAQLGGAEAEQRLTATGEFQLLEAIIVRLLQRATLDDITHNDVTRLFLMKSVVEEQFLSKSPPKGYTWVAPLRACQMEKCYPAFWSMFFKHPGPVPWQFMCQCAVSYCYAEETKSD